MVVIVVVIVVVTVAVIVVVTAVVTVVVTVVVMVVMVVMVVIVVLEMGVIVVVLWILMTAIIHLSILKIKYHMIDERSIDTGYDFLDHCVISFLLLKHSSRKHIDHLERTVGYHSLQIPYSPLLLLFTMKV